MQWQDEGIVLGVRRHGETAAIADVLTRDHGRHLGLVRGGRSRAMRPVLQAGNTVSARWSARIADHLGTFVLEPMGMRVARIIDDRFKLAGLATLTGLSALLPEREPHARIFEALKVALDALDDDRVWPAVLVRFELGLLDELGFGLDLSRCAATGSRDNLVYVSPRSGRAVGAEAGASYRERLLALPSFLLGSQADPPGGAGVLDGLRLTGYFLDRHVFHPRGLVPPDARRYVLERLEREALPEIP
ncbi:MAG: DNA repair protein RecO [Parvibaculaceae bacterium]